MEDLSELQNYFSTGNAETESDFIDDVYFQDAKFNEIVKFPARTIRILVGKKGSGKSALLEVLKIRCDKSKIPCIHIKPDDFPLRIDKSNPAIADIKNEAFNSLLRIIAIELGSVLADQVDKDSRSVLQAAIDDGRISPANIAKFKEILIPIGKGLTNIEFEKIFGNRIYTKSELKSGINTLSKNSELYFYLLIDDTDQIASVSSENYLETIWGLIIAAQKISEELPNIKPIITIREEVWNRLRLDNHGARDQIDHYRNTVKRLNCTEDSLRQILYNRLNYCKNILHPHMKGSPYECFFEGSSCKLPSSSERRSWDDYIITSSRYRPRDSVQMVFKLSEYAMKSGRNIINDEDVEKSAYEYSKERIEDIVNENQYLCDELYIVLKSFIKLEFENSAEIIKEHLKVLPGTCRIEVKKNVIRTENEEDAFVLWKLLYDMEFLTPRLLDARMPRGFSFIRPIDDPELVSKSRWNEMTRFSWDIHPSYRSFLIFEKAKEKAYEMVKKA